MDGVQGVDKAEAPLVPSEMRVSDQDRDSAVEVLSEHAAAGCLTLDELEERVSVALAARTRGELGALTRDLPGNAGRPVERRKAVRWMIAVMGGDEIDLRDAELDGSQVTLTVISIMGGANIYVPDTVEVEVSGFSLMGGDNEYGAPRPPRPGAPLVRIRSYNLMGGSSIYRLPAHARGLSLKEARRGAKATERRELPARD